MVDINLTVEENEVPVDMDIDEAQTVLETDHEKLTHRDAADSHPIDAITGLAEALKAQSEATASLEKKILRPMTAAEAEEILNA